LREVAFISALHRPHRGSVSSLTKKSTGYLVVKKGHPKFSNASLGFGHIMGDEEFLQEAVDGNFEIRDGPAIARAPDALEP
jgi:hypothetical protein